MTIARPEVGLQEVSSLTTRTGYGARRGAPHDHIPAAIGSPAPTACGCAHGSTEISRTHQISPTTLATEGVDGYASPSRLICACDRCHRRGPVERVWGGRWWVCATCGLEEGL